MAHEKEHSLCVELYFMVVYRVSCIKYRVLNIRKLTKYV